MTVTASAAVWERWTGMPLPESGQYVIPGAFQLVVIDRASAYTKTPTFGCGTRFFSGSAAPAFLFRSSAGRNIAAGGGQQRPCINPSLRRLVAEKCARKSHGRKTVFFAEVRALNGRAIDFTEGPIAHRTLRFAGPLFLSNLLQTSYQLVNSLWVDNLLEDDAHAAFSLIAHHLDHVHDRHQRDDDDPVAASRAGRRGGDSDEASRANPLAARQGSQKKSFLKSGPESPWPPTLSPISYGERNERKWSLSSSTKPIDVHSISPPKPAPPYGVPPTAEQTQAGLVRGGAVDPRSTRMCGITAETEMSLRSNTIWRISTDSSPSV